MKLIIFGLAIYRLTRFISIDIGPYGVFEKIRLWFAKRSTHSEFNNQIAIAIHCPYCIGVWIALALSPLYFWDNDIVIGVLSIIAIMGLQTFLQSGDKDADNS